MSLDLRIIREGQGVKLPGLGPEHRAAYLLAAAFAIGSEADATRFAGGRVVQSALANADWTYPEVLIITPGTIEAWTLPIAFGLFYELPLTVGAYTLQRTYDFKYLPADNSEGISFTLLAGDIIETNCF